MESIKLWARHGEAVRQAIELGELVHMETASEELTDEFLLFAIDSGLLKTWAEAFPDPRREPEIGMEVILSAHLAGRSNTWWMRPRPKSAPCRSPINWSSGTTSMLRSPCYSTPAWGGADGFISSIPRASRCRSQPGRMSGVAWSKTMTERMRAGTSWPRYRPYLTVPVCSAR